MLPQHQTNEPQLSALDLQIQNYSRIILEASKIPLVDDAEEYQVIKYVQQIQKSLADSTECLSEMERIEGMNQTPKEANRDVIPISTMTNLELITNNTKNILINLSVMKQIDAIMRNKWYNLETDDVWNLIYSVTFMFDLSDIFQGSYLSERAIEYSQEILTGILNRKRVNLSPDQRSEMQKLLESPCLKRYDMAMLEWQTKQQQFAENLGSTSIESKIQGIKDLIEFFGSMKTYKDQLKIFATKMKPMMKVLLDDLTIFKTNIEEPIFDDFIHQLLQFMLALICDTHFQVILDEGHQTQTDAQSYQLEYIGDILTNMEGLFATIATISNFLMKFSDKVSVLNKLMAITKRLYNFFPHYRMHLEDTIIMTFIKVLQNKAQYENSSHIWDPVKRQLAGGIKINLDILYDNALEWMTFLLQSNHVDQSFKQKMQSKEQLRPYLQDISQRKSKVEYSNMKYHIFPQRFSDLDLNISHPNVAEIAAGEEFGFVAEIAYENSIICINFKTEDYDVFVGIYKASPISRFDKIESADGVDLIDHPLSGGTPLQEIQALKQVDSSTPKAINFLASEPGFYKVIFSNKHSWLRAKKLLYSYNVLRPTDEQIKLTKNAREEEERKRAWQPPVAPQMQQNMQIQQQIYNQQRAINDGSPEQIGYQRLPEGVEQIVTLNESVDVDKQHSNPKINPYNTSPSRGGETYPQQTNPYHRNVNENLYNTTPIVEDQVAQGRPLENATAAAASTVPETPAAKVQTSEAEVQTDEVQEEKKNEAVAVVQQPAPSLDRKTQITERLQRFTNKQFKGDEQAPSTALVLNLAELSLFDGTQTKKCPSIINLILTFKSTIDQIKFKHLQSLQLQLFVIFIDLQENNENLEMVTKTIQDMAEATPNPQALQFIISNDKDILQMHSALSLPEDHSSIQITSISNNIVVFMGQTQMNEHFTNMILQDSTIAEPQEVEIENQNLKSLHLLAYKLKVLFDTCQITLTYYLLDEESELDNDKIKEILGSSATVAAGSGVYKVKEYQQLLQDQMQQLV